MAFKKLKIGSNAAVDVNDARIDSISPITNDQIDAIFLEEES